MRITRKLLWYDKTTDSVVDTVLLNFVASMHSRLSHARDVCPSVKRVKCDKTKETFA